MYYKQHRTVELRVPASVVGQIQCIVDHFDTEVSWFGDIEVEGDVYTIKNVYLFPQVVTGGTFRTDTPQVTELYDAWYESKLNEVADWYDKTGESISIMQYNGHSHVRAGVSPSTEDMKYRKSRPGINIYSIQNKQGDSEWEIWTNDMVFENEDIDIMWVDDVFKVADDYVLKPPAGNQWGGVYNQYNHTTTPAVTQQKKIQPPKEPESGKELSIVKTDEEFWADLEAEEEIEKLWREEWEQYGYGCEYAFPDYTPDGARL